MNQMQALIIDDNSINVTVISQLLVEEGIVSYYAVDLATLDQVLAGESNYCVVFLDLEMPFNDGYEVLDRLKSNPYFSRTPVIAYTVHVSEMQQAYKKGFDGFIGKPLDSDKFSDQLAKILNGEPVWEIP